MAGEEKKLGDINVTMGDGNSVSHIGHQYFVNPPRLEFSDPLGQELLAHLPEGRVIGVEITGSQADLAVGAKIVNFLRSHGRHVMVMTTGMMIPPPSRPIALEQNGDRVHLVIAPSAR